MTKVQKWLAAGALLGFAVCFSGIATAATNQAMICKVPTEAGKPVNVGCGGTAQTGQVYGTPVDSDLVRVRSDGATVADWSSNAYVWKAWKDVAPGAYYDVCTSDVPVGALLTGGACTTWGMIPRPLTNTTGVVTLTWTPPTQYTDGTTITDLAGFYVYQGGVKLATTLGPAATKLDIPLPVGTFVFALSAYTTAGVESDKTPTVSVTVTKPAPTKKPGVPTQFKATVTLTLP